MTPVAVFCSGHGSNFQALLDATVRKKGRLPVRIALMISDNPKAYAIRRAALAGVPVCCLKPQLFPDRSAYEKVLIGILRSQKVEVVALAGFMRIFTPAFIRAYRGRIVNIHPSYLPAFKGAHAIRDAYRAGVRRTGVTVHLVTAKVDAGPVLAQKRVPVRRGDTLAALEARVHRTEHRLYPEALGRFVRSLRKKPSARR